MSLYGHIQLILLAYLFSYGQCIMVEIRTKNLLFFNKVDEIFAISGIHIPGGRNQKFLFLFIFGWDLNS